MTNAQKHRQLTLLKKLIHPFCLEVTATSDLEEFFIFDRRNHTLPRILQRAADVTDISSLGYYSLVFRWPLR